MSARSIRYRLNETNNIWPGFVDVLATLLMVIIFILMVFTVSQIYLSDAISGRDKALENLRYQINELSKILIIESKEKQEAFEFGGFNFASESLSLLDNIDRAIMSFRNDENLKNNKDLNKIIDGIEVVKKDLVSIFKKNGIESIECINKKFDPNFHQAMLEVEDNTKEPGTVIQEIQKGYMMKDRLLRPSLVGVTKKREQKDKETKTNETKSEKNDEKK